MVVDEELRRDYINCVHAAQEDETRVRVYVTD